MMFSGGLSPNILPLLAGKSPSPANLNELLQHANHVESLQRLQRTPSETKDKDHQSNNNNNGHRKFHRQNGLNNNHYNNSTSTNTNHNNKQHMGATATHSQSYTGKRTHDGTNSSNNLTNDTKQVPDTACGRCGKRSLHWRVNCQETHDIDGDPISKDNSGYHWMNKTRTAKALQRNNNPTSTSTSNRIAFSGIKQDDNRDESNDDDNLVVIEHAGKKTKYVRFV